MRRLRMAGLQVLDGIMWVVAVIVVAGYFVLLGVAGLVVLLLPNRSFR